MGLVVTVTANAALDHTLYVEQLRTGERQRVEFERLQAGGKGVNVSRILAALDWGVRSVVILGGSSGRAIERDLGESGLVPVAIAAPGESRTCLEIIETRTGAVTQLHGAGVRGSEETTRELLAVVEASLDGADWLALCGSLPAGCPEDTYGRLVDCARRHGVRVALDASGPALVFGWRAGPDLLRINREEAAGAIGRGPTADLVVPPSNVPGSARLSVVSDGPRFAWVWGADGIVWRVRPPSVQECNPIGCGDAMLAGMIAAHDSSIEYALRFATALAAADAESRCAGRPELARARALVSAVSVERV